MSFPINLKLRIDWSEMDLFGHVNNVMYFKYIQAARVNYWEHIGMTDEFKRSGLGPILASSSCQFLKPLHYPGTVTIESKVEFMKNTSFGLHHRLLNDKGEFAAEAKDVVVLFNFKTNEKVTIPDNVRKLVEDIEGKKY
jgi:acyl-CoA thioester hydrolase